MPTDWYPLRTDNSAVRPNVGDLIAAEHAVWRVTRIADLILNDTETQMWINAGMPDPWRLRPYRVHLDHVGGVRPDWAPKDGPVQSSAIDIRDGRMPQWYRYWGERWPMCSCCGEPMPCRAELRDKAVTAGANKLEMLSKRKPGDCWHCGEVITHRQKAVTYPGDNLDLPIGPQVKFHTRHDCRYYAERYEERWIAEDPRRERILTWPTCGGLLLVHADGTSECHTGRSPLGGTLTGAPDCRGHLTHDHGSRMACYVPGTPTAIDADAPTCTRGCPREGHPGTATSRPERRDLRTLL